MQEDVGGACGWGFERESERVGQTVAALLDCSGEQTAASWTQPAFWTAGLHTVRKLLSPGTSGEHSHLLSAIWF